MIDEVTGYLGGVPDNRRPTLERLRRLCLDELPGFGEAMRYGMPGYLRDGEVEVAFANQKRHIALYVLRTDVMAAHRDQLEGLDVGKGAIRFTDGNRIDWDVVRSMLQATAGSTGPVC